MQTLPPASRGPFLSLSQPLLFILLLLGALVTGCSSKPPPPPQSEPQPGAGGQPSEGRLPECVIAQGSAALAPATSSTFTTLEKGVLTVGSNTTYPPFESIENGKPAGFDIALITEIARRLGLRPEIKSSPFETIFLSLTAHKVDAVISAVTITEDRKRNVDFTRPYLSADQSLTVKAADAATIRTVDDLKGKVVGVQSATTGESCARNALMAKGKVRDVRSYENAPTAYDDTLTGRVQAVLNDLPTSRRIVEQKPGLAIVQVLRTDEQYGIAVAKDNPNLREAINRQLAAIEDDGTYRQLYKQWLGTEPPPA